MICAGFVLEVYTARWLTTYKRHKLKPTSLSTYEKSLNAHLLPAFGERAIASITTDDVQRFLNERSQLSRKSLTMLRNLMGEIFKDAMEDGLI